MSESDKTYTVCLRFVNDDFADNDTYTDSTTAASVDEAVRTVADMARDNERAGDWEVDHIMEGTPVYVSTDTIESGSIVYNEIDDELVLSFDTSET